MIKVFLDCDVLLDMMITRKDPVLKIAAISLFDAFERQKNLSPCTSPLVLSNIYYIARKQHGSSGALEIIKTFLDSVSIIKVDQECVDGAFSEEKIKDFEDLIQYHSAIRSGVEYFVTRNIKDFPQRDSMIIISPDHMLKILIEREM